MSGGNFLDRTRPGQVVKRQFHKKGMLGAIECLERRELLAVTLVEDLRTSGDGSDPQEYAEFRDYAFFQARDDQYGVELWRTDGTAEGTMLFADLAPGLESSMPRGMTAGDSYLYFVTEDMTEAVLWRTGEMPGQVEAIVEFPRGDRSQYNRLDLEYFDGSLFVVTDDDVHGRSLVKLNAQEDGVEVLRTYTDGFYSVDLRASGDRLYYNAFESPSAGATRGYRVVLYSTDGQLGGEVPVGEFGQFEDSRYELHDGTVYQTVLFGREERAELQRVDIDVMTGAPSATTLGSFTLDDAEIDAAPRILAFIETGFYFSLFDGSELWKSDGTVEGTELIKQFSTDWTTDGAAVIGAYAVGDTALLRVQSVATGTELWTTDGTSAGTVLLRDIAVGEASSEPQDFVSIAGGVLFAADDGEHGREIWFTDGTAEGTELFGDLYPGASSSLGNLGLSGAIVLGDQLLFTANDGQLGRELWQSDGTRAGTAVLSDLNAGSTEGAYPHGLTSVGDRVYFVADDGNLGFELWSSNGTAGGTELVVDAVPGVATNYWSAEQVVQSLQNSSDAYWYAAQFLNHDLVLEYNGDAYFTLFETAVGTNQLWKAVDGQRQFVANLRSSQYSVPLVGAPLNGELVFFEYAGGLQGYNVWRTDGTTEGTRFVKQINTAPTYSDPDFAVLDDLMYVASRQTFAGDNELWQVGVTAEDTRLVADLAPGEASSFPAAFTVHHGLLYFVATNPESTNLALWRSDGTASGTMPLVTNSGATYTRFIRSIDSSASGLYYVQSESFGRDRTDRQQELWYTDGTPGGEVLLRSEYAADFADHSIQVLASTDAGVYFRAGDASLWFATPQGVERVSEVAVCGVEYSSCEAVMWNDWLYFPGDDGQHGMELWRSNGTPTGTEMVADISAGTPSSYPAELTIVGDSLYFTADDKIHGPELWRFVESLPGDANFDGVVDAIDLEIWSENAMSVGASASRGDFNSDGVVDVRDFNVWLAHRFTSAKANEAASTVSRTPRAASHDARDVGATAEVELLSTHNLSSQWRMVTATTDEPRRQSSDNIAGRTIISYRSMHNSIQRRRGGMSLDMALSPSQTEPAEVPLTTQPIDDVFASQQWQ